MIVPGGDHNDTFLRAGVEYTNRLQQFMDKCNGEITKERYYEDIKEEIEEELKDPYQQDERDNLQGQVSSENAQEEEEHKDGGTSKVEDEDKDANAKK